MRIDRDLVPEVTRTVPARKFLIGCAVFVLGVVGGMLAGAFLSAWMGQRVAVTESVGALISLGALWGGLMGAVGSALIGSLVSRRARPPDGGTRLIVAVWMGLWLIASMAFEERGVVGGCLEEGCYQFAGGTAPTLYVIGGIALVLSVVGSLILPSTSRRWVAIGAGAIASPALFVGAVAFAPVTLTPRPSLEEVIEKLNAPTALGNLEIRFLAPNEPPTVVRPLTKVEVLLRLPNATVSQAYDVTGSDGGFGIKLDPGVYTVDGLLLRGRAVGKPQIPFPVSGPSFEVPETGCVYLGRMVFSFVSVRPGTYSGTEGLVEYIERAGGDPSKGFEWVNMKVGFIAQGPVVVELPPPEARAAGWEDCTLQQATL